MIKPYLSVVIPFCNEEAVIEELSKSLVSVMDKSKVNYEIIYVDDGSSDNTYEEIEKAYEKYENIKVIRLGKNYGQSTALSAGIDHALGEILVLMDGDMQHSPEDIPKFIEKINEGYDIVSGWRKNRSDNFFNRRLPSWIANRIASKISGVNIHDFGATFKAYKSEILKSVRLYDSLHRFIPALASWTGARICEIEIQSGQRKSGKSKYGISRTLVVVLDLIAINFLLKYKSKPLQFFGKIGLLFSFSGFLGLMALSLGWAFFELNMIENRGTLLLAALAIIIGIQFIASGLVAELISRTYYETQNKKLYYIKTQKIRE